VSVARLAVLGLGLAALAAGSAGAAHPMLQQPFDLLPVPNGHLIVADMPANTVYDLDPARNSGRVVARIREARELARLPDGRILVTSHDRVMALNLRTGKSSVYLTARGYILGIALAPDGWLYVSENQVGHEETDVVRFRGGTREVLAPDLRGVHGILYTDRGLILGEAYAGRVLRLDPATRTITVLAAGLGNPGFALPAAGGGYYVSEFYGNRISRLWPDGHVTTIAPVLQPGPIAFDLLHRIIGVSLSGVVFRIVRGTSRTIYS